MEDNLQARSSIPGLLLQTVKISVLLFQNRIHLYNFLLLKIFHFNHWVSGLAQEAEGLESLSPAPSQSCLFCPLGSMMRGLVTLWTSLVFLVLHLPWPFLTRILNSPFTLYQLCQAVWDHLSFFWGTWKSFLHYWLHSFLLGVLVTLLITWRLFQTAHRLSIRQLKRLALMNNRFSLELLGLLRRLYWHVESTAALTSWHLAYVVTWATCLASHMLQAAFEHTVQLAQAQEGEIDILWEDSIMESLLPEETKTLDE